ncbi:GNAT family N-acetyltransferase [Halobaculum litoreum]|uniref:GNAT family N-acetyltransferase n=1 Tax=Halobaculum litoreum TaxID=3031998 RepID=A0ABD5XXV2_9EURY
MFDRPDRLVIDDLYVRELYRGGDLARDLVGRAASYAEAADCPQVALGVDTDNERARAFYDSLGFEPRRHRLVVDTAEL